MGASIDPAIADVRVAILSACDENYFPLFKGLVLSLLEGFGGRMPFELGVLDLGCEGTSLDWLIANGIAIIKPEDSPMGALGAAQYGYHRAQICRPYLPEIFPDASILAWIDCDIWFQDPYIILELVRDCQLYIDCIIISPEVHYTYSRPNDQPSITRSEILTYYSTLYTESLARELHLFPTLNSGFFLAERSHPLWQKWKVEISDIYARRYATLEPILRHFGEQLSLNKLIRLECKARYFDPLANYLCLWNLPYRDEQGVVRVAYPPYDKVRALHLAGGWRYFGESYLNAGLLYQEGRYLSEGERGRLIELSRGNRFR